MQSTFTHPQLISAALPISWAAAARVGFFKTRAELLGETFPRLVTEWAQAHAVQPTGHAPGNYDLQPTETIGDPGNSPQLPPGAYAYHDADYQAVGEMLLSELHRDFSFVHPDALGGKVTGNRLILQNAVNNEEYRSLVLPGAGVTEVGLQVDTVSSIAIVGSRQ